MLLVLVVAVAAGSRRMASVGGAVGVAGSSRRGVVRVVARAAVVGAGSSSGSGRSRNSQ